MIKHEISYYGNGFGIKWEIDLPFRIHKSDIVSDEIFDECEVVNGDYEAKNKKGEYVWDYTSYGVEISEVEIFADYIAVFLDTNPRFDKPVTK